MPFRGEGDAALYARDYPVQQLNRHFTEFTQNHFVNDAQNPYEVGEGAFTWFRSYQMGGRSLTWGRQCYRWSDYDFGANKRDGHGTDWPIRYADLAPWYDKVEEFVGVSGAKEGLAQLPDGHFQPPMALNAVEQAVREKSSSSGPTAASPWAGPPTSPRPSPNWGAGPASTATSACAAVPSAPISRRNPALCPPPPQPVG
jgi:choline dehydrogenase-like flavoprotein